MAAPVTELIVAVSGRLTPVERRLAELVAADPTVVAFATAAELAARAGASRPSVVRFAVKLGFEGYGALQQHARAQLSLELKRPAERIRDEVDRGAPLVALEQALQSIASATHKPETAAAATQLARARAVWLLSGETSAAGALSLLSGLAMLRPGVTLLEEHTFARDLASVQRDDVVVAIGFYRYRRWAVESTQALARRGATIIAITDSPLSPFASAAKIWFEVLVPAVGPFDSSVPPVATAEILIAATAKALGPKAMKRIDRIEAMWGTTSTFLPDAY
jgi:DNA-binding MurR/RpiR family transcriptional regulator